jgi:hypothetical protein
MIFEIRCEVDGVAQIFSTPDIEGIYESPQAAKTDLEYLLKTYPAEYKFSIWRDGVRLSAAQVEQDIQSHEIRAVRDAQTKLPATHRHGLGHRHDDVALGPRGEPVKVWGPENPEDAHN